MLDNIDSLLGYASKIQKEKEAGQTDLFGGSDDVHTQAKLVLAPGTSNYTNSDQLAWERELLGLYLSQHPLQEYRAYLEEKAIPLTELKAEHDNKTVTVGGAIGEMREITTKSGQKMAFAKLADEFTERELVVFPSVYSETIAVWQRDKVLIVKGKVNAKDRAGNPTDEVKILVDSAEELTSNTIKDFKQSGKRLKIPKGKPVANAKKQEKNVPRLYVRLDSSKDEAVLISIKQAIDAHPGETEVVLVIGKDQKQAVRLPQKITAQDGLNALAEVVGKDHVKLH